MSRPLMPWSQRWPPPARPPVSTAGRTVSRPLMPWSQRWPLASAAAAGLEGRSNSVSTAHALVPALGPRRPPRRPRRCLDRCLDRSVVPSSAGPPRADLQGGRVCGGGLDRSTKKFAARRRIGAARAVVRSCSELRRNFRGGTSNNSEPGSIYRKAWLVKSESAHGDTTPYPYGVWCLAARASRQPIGPACLPTRSIGGGLSKRLLTGSLITGIQVAPRMRGPSRDSFLERTRTTPSRTGDGRSSRRGAWERQPAWRSANGRADEPAWRPQGLLPSNGQQTAIDGNGATLAALQGLGARRPKSPRFLARARTAVGVSVSCWADGGRGNAAGSPTRDSSVGDCEWMETLGPPA